MTANQYAPAIRSDAENFSHRCDSLLHIPTPFISVRDKVMTISPSWTKFHLSMLLLCSSHGTGDASNVANARND